MKQMKTSKQHKKNKLRSDIFLLVMSVCCVLMHVGTLQAETTIPEMTQIHYQYQNLSYTFTGSSSTDSGYIANVESYFPGAISNSGVLEIPDTITYNNGTKDLVIPVAGILTGAFSGCTTLKELTLPQSVSYIGQEAFANCVNLSKISTRGLTGTGNLRIQAVETYYEPGYRNKVLSQAH